ncbi:thioesterase II family protein [Flavobacterium sp. ENC]|uniref:thioesterase II family protein n=1 Tax=Flavobacterium sp. ENC TaxID=2897330 RepID=UPI001E50E6E3|nr:thioesterase domain-containing protein [Flavobacterium sp. ENC]MCD0465157.1 thioesterase domain-containing protein [Flavobacterium sp. ENC]
MQLFLLHFAGGNVYSFEFLRKEIKNSDFIPLELPGRGKRHRENLVTNKDQAIEDYCRQIQSLRNGEPYMIYGHSMGATLGLSVAAKMERTGDRPKALIVSGNPGPGIKKSKDFLYHELDDFNFKKELLRLGGISTAITENKDLFDYFLPIIRADFECLEKDFFSEKGLKVNIPIYALMGAGEETCDRIENWKNFTSHTFTSEIWSGNHFFIHNNAAALAHIFSSLMQKQITHPNTNYYV